ncbi:hypothetical protein FEM48_Zijuj10G0009200 [Ziziphus jujuba var. spinosa]|uniref:Disease resistance protein At3g14460 n=1 Tax=Ziziphus jujuba var. spinosa TaxID=714518 RepID=A0A978UKC0_ZIZJJ|nr:hypothetical protein FEM48_Zijuj10G0009200 [Ziziphus jujuba var. spinosa]
MWTSNAIGVYGREFHNRDFLVLLQICIGFRGLKVLQDELIIDGDEVVVSSLPRTPVLRELKLGCCEKLKLQDLVLPQTLKSIAIGKRYLRDDINSIEIQNCEKVEFPLHHSLRSSIEMVEIRNSCGSLECFPLDFFPNLRKLIIEGCKNLESLTITKSSDDMIPLSELRIYECPNFISFPCNGRLHAPNLTHLSIRGCQKLKKLPEQMSNLLPSLNSLEISNCPEVESFPEGGLPFNLAQLTVGGCEKLKALPEQMCNLLPSLNSLEIFDCPEVEESFAEVDLPPNLTQLTVGGCKRLKALPEQMFNLLSCLKELQMGDCPEVESFPEVDLPSNLTQLKVSGCKKLKNGASGSKACTGTKFLTSPPLKSMKSYHRLQDQSMHLPCISDTHDHNAWHGKDTSIIPNLPLPQLLICGCPKFLYFPKGGLHASNLSWLVVDDCKKLKKLYGQMHNLLPSLKGLSIVDAKRWSLFLKAVYTKSCSTCCCQLL